MSKRCAVCTLILQTATPNGYVKSVMHPVQILHSHNYRDGKSKENDLLSQLHLNQMKLIAHSHCHIRRPPIIIIKA